MASSMSSAHASAAAGTSTEMVGPHQGSSSSCSSQAPVLHLVLQPRPQHHVRWTADTIDNEHMNKKKSKKCCIYHKPRAFGESSSSSSGSDLEDGEGPSPAASSASAPSARAPTEALRAGAAAPAAAAGWLRRRAMEAGSRLLADPCADWGASRTAGRPPTDPPARRTASVQAALPQQRRRFQARCGGARAPSRAGPAARHLARALCALACAAQRTLCFGRHVQRRRRAAGRDPR
eukprot:CAMPEP_0176208714 /NCGR_PEP_ID=MMETSP0121_2-20121125/13266_1 /TAXON_ID=160619 /ORGANISM="Kryptoperidinium foliaceum, Strain CCMP 1326" /LENGTH=234 /DNA_ID=CAMNT_0017547715 /DNA_START=84 /DNA_END=786 /DNA_ORIENTATION=+